MLSCPHRNVRHTFACLVEGTAVHLLMFCNLLFSKMVLLEDLHDGDDHVFITISLVVRRLMLDVNRGEVAQSPGRHLRARFISSFCHPSAEYRGMVVFALRFASAVFASSFLHRAFFLVAPMLRGRMALSKLQSALILFILSWSEQTPQKHMFNPSCTCVKQERH